MKTSNLIIIFPLAFAFIGCIEDESTVNNETPPDQVSPRLTASADDNGGLPTEIYYAVERDYRKCMAPMCGGYWLQAVNLDETVCADGTVGGENGCYVAGLDLHGIDLRGGDLLLGEFRKVEYGSIIADHLDVEAAFSPALAEAQPYGWINLIQDTGIRCFTTPCPSAKISMVNTSHAWTEYGFSYDVIGEKKEILERAFSDAYAKGGALVQSRWSKNGWWSWELLVTNVYVRSEATFEGPFCTYMKKEGENSYVAWNVETYEQGKNLLAGGGFEPGTENIVQGTCESYSNVCTEQYEPVCGTLDTTGEAKTYSNQCFLEVAVRQGAGSDSKATGTWYDGACEKPAGIVGDPCGGRLGLTCQKELFCKYRMKDRCGSFDMTGVCSELAEMCIQVSKPICGCDGRDYSNECAAWQHGISAAHDGNCE